MGKKFSIITPSYNQGKFLRRCIESVLSQGDNVEYIIIDGGSDDNSVDIIKEFNDVDFWVCEKDQGQTDAINKGWLRSTGEIFNWLNCDDFLMPNVLELIESEFCGKKELEVLCGFSRIKFGNGKSTLKRTSDPTHNNIRFLSEGQIVQPSTFWKKDVLDRYMPLPIGLNFMMDHYLLLKYLSESDVPKIRFSNEVLAEITVHPSAKSFSSLPEFQEEQQWIYHALYRSYGLTPPEFLEEGPLELSFMPNNKNIHNSLKALDSHLRYSMLFRRDHFGKKMGINKWTLRGLDISQLIELLKVRLFKSQIF